MPECFALALRFFDGKGFTLGAVINYNYTLLAARVPAPSLVCWDGRDHADSARFLGLIDDAP
ncbi:MAG: hypothetical protein KME27_12075 [Lyngbya sp. HA4199-MV5]|jgi:hypothetical protein|nr:hypothetical protein [Lyngbya sp. HA4199-MV5]